MDLKILPAELVQEILDRVPFSEWLASIILVCKEWKKLCETSRSHNKCLIINEHVVPSSHRVKLDVILHLISKYQVTGLDLSGVTEIPSTDVLTASKQLKWLTLNIRSVNTALKASEPYNVEILSVVRGPSDWNYSLSKFPAAKFFSKFPKLRIFSASQLFSWKNNQQLQNAPANTEILYTSNEYTHGYIYTYLDTVVKGFPKLKKLVLNLTNVYGDFIVKDIDNICEALESYMEKNYKGVQFVVRNPIFFVEDLDLFKHAYHKNGFPYEYYTPYGKVTLFSLACDKEALDTMKYLIDSGITSFEKELKFDPRTMMAHERMQRHYYFDDHALFLPPNNYADLGANETHQKIVDYLISLGLTCETKGKNGQVFYEIFGVTHPILPYVTLRSPPRLAANTITELMHAKSPYYQIYLNEIYFKSSKEIQDEVKKVLVDFDFSDVLYYVIESRDLQTIKHVVEEFNIDLTKYRDAINECPAMEDCIEVKDYVNNLLNKNVNVN